MKPVAGVDGVRGIDDLCGDDEPLAFPRFPGKDEMAMPAGPFVAEVVGVDAIALGEQHDAIGLGDFLAIDGFLPGVPDAEDDPALRLAVDLHPEIPAMP